MTATALQWRLTLQVTVAPEWIDAIFPGVRRLLEIVQARNARMQSGKGQADDLISDRAAEGFLPTVLYSGICFWQNLPFRTQSDCDSTALACCSPATKKHKVTTMEFCCRYGLAYVLHRLPAVANIIVTPQYLQFTQQVMSSHDKANRQAEMDVSPAILVCGTWHFPDPQGTLSFIAHHLCKSAPTPKHQNKQQMLHTH